jgi:hypothetical protein
MLMLMLTIIAVLMLSSVQRVEPCTWCTANPKFLPNARFARLDASKTVESYPDDNCRDTQDLKTATERILEGMKGGRQSAAVL